MRARQSRTTARALSPVRARSVAVVLVVLAAVVVLGAGDSVRRLGHLEHRRDEALASRSDPADVAGDVAEAFRRFRSTLDDGDRFALAFGPDVGRDQAGYYRLVALSYLYPAIAVSDPEGADAVMAFGGEPTGSIREDFEPIEVVEGVWLGRRRQT